MKITSCNGILTDENSNSASIKYWGSEENAREALESCYNCFSCRNCFNCSSCLNCLNCSSCFGCSRCSGCNGCFNCSDSQNEKGNFVVPVIPDIHKKLLTAVESGSLYMGKWHTCETTHCRAGWIIHLAGEAGYELENETSPVFAAMQIYKASGYKISPDRFFERGEVAMDDIRRLAEV